jgi:hypothetical protein
MPEAPPKISTFLFREFCIPAQLSLSRRSTIVKARATTPPRPAFLHMKAASPGQISPVRINLSGDKTSRISYSLRLAV